MKTSAKLELEILSDSPKEIREGLNCVWKEHGGNALGARLPESLAEEVIILMYEALEGKP